MTLRLLAPAALGVAMAFNAHAVEPRAAALDRDAPQPQSQDEAPLSDRFCLRHTGSRITIAESRRQARLERTGRADAQRPVCAMVPGRAYTREDLLRTGAFDTAEALRRLDPAFY